MFAKTLFAVSILLVTVACASGGVSHRVPSELLQAIPSPDRAALETKERHFEDATKALAKAEDDLRGAQLDLRKAELDRETTVVRIDANNEILKLAQDVEGGDRAVRAAKVGTALEALVEANDEDISWREEMLEYAEIGVAVTKARHDLADAELESARADSVASSNVPGKEDIVLSDFKMQVSQLLQNASSLEQDSSEQWKEAEEARAEYEAAFKAVPAEASEDRAALVEAKANLKTSKDAHASCTKKVDDLAKSVGQCKQSLTTCEQEKAEAAEAAPPPVPAETGGDAEPE